jgi:type I restriction enzyme S subunit
MARTIPKGWQELEIKDFLKFTPREVTKPKEQYRSLGIRSHCKGTFVRDVENPDKVMMETLYAVKKNDLIVNITFAWEGAIALVKESDEGALVSHRFPTYVFNRDVVIPEFFQYLIPSKRFVYNLGIISPGGAGRNRVLDRKDFLHLQFIMPPVPEQKKIAEILSTWDRAIETLDKLISAKTRLKKGLMQKLLTGKVRFKGYKDHWQDHEYENVFETVSAKKNQISKDKYMESGKHPVVDQGQLLIAGYTDEERVFQDIPIIVFGDHTRIIKWIEFPFVVGADGTQLLKTRPICDQKYGYYILSYLRLPNLGYSRHFKVVKDSTFYISVNKAEQKKIAGVLSIVDREIESLTRIQEKIKSQKQGLMQKLLTGKIRVFPGKGKDGAK